jgi:hypothetical protein
MTRYQRSAQLWSLLLGMAERRQTCTYTMLANRLGFTGRQAPRSIGNFLEPIQRYCYYRGLPILTVLVVQSWSGLPGAGCLVSDPNAERERVYAWDWYAIAPPETRHFERAVAFEAQGLRGEMERGKGA